MSCVLCVVCLCVCARARASCACVRVCVSCCAATSSHTKALELKTAKHQDWFTLFETVVTGDDPAVKAGKPAPDIFIEAARRLVRLVLSQCARNSCVVCVVCVVC